jgi:hypothetical protein
MKKEAGMNLADAMRVCRLMREYQRALKRVDSLVRRIIVLLDSAPEDTLLRETALDALEHAIADTLDLTASRILVAREGADSLIDEDNEEKEPRNGND